MSQYANPQKVPTAENSPEAKAIVRQSSLGEPPGRTNRRTKTRKMLTKSRKARRRALVGLPGSLLCVAIWSSMADATTKTKKEGIRVRKPIQRESPYGPGKRKNATTAKMTPLPSVARKTRMEKRKIAAKTFM